MRQVVAHITNMLKFGILNIKKYHTMSVTNFQGPTTVSTKLWEAVQRMGETTVNGIFDAMTTKTTTLCRPRSRDGGIILVGPFAPAPDDTSRQLRLRNYRHRCSPTTTTQATALSPSTQATTLSPSIPDVVTNREQDETNHGNEPTPEAFSIFSDPTVTIPFTVVGCLSGGVAGAVTMDGVSKIKNSEGNQKILQGFKIAAGIAAAGTLAAGVSCLVGPLLGGVGVFASFGVGGFARVAAHNHLCKRNYSAVSKNPEQV